MQTSRSNFQTTFDCGCYEDAFSRTVICNGHKFSLHYYIRSQKGFADSHNWQYYQKLATEQPKEVVST